MLFICSYIPLVTITNTHTYCNNHYVFIRARYIGHNTLVIIMLVNIS